MDPLDLISFNPRPRFRRQPLPVLGEHRLLWQLALIVVLLYIAGRSGREKRKRMSLRKLHILSWAVRSDQGCEALRARLQSVRVANVPAVRVDPSFNYAIDFASAENLIFCEEKHVDLLPAGEKLASQIMDVGVLADERRRASVLKPVCTEKAIESVSRSS